jgi:hypothetical protein
MNSCLAGEDVPGHVKILKISVSRGSLLQAKYKSPFNLKGILVVGIALPAICCFAA